MDQSTKITPPNEAVPLIGYSVNGSTQFLSHNDCVNQRLEEASGLIVLFESAYAAEADAARIPGATEGIDGISSINPLIVAQAMNGIRTLIDLAHWHANQRRAGK